MLSKNYLCHVIFIQFCADLNSQFEWLKGNSQFCVQYLVVILNFSRSICNSILCLEESRLSIFRQ